MKRAALGYILAYMLNGAGESKLVRFALLLLPLAIQAAPPSGEAVEASRLQDVLDWIESHRPIP